MSKNTLEDIPVKSHHKSRNLPKQFDARTTWPQCSTIGRILGQCTLFLLLCFLLCIGY